MNSQKQSKPTILVVDDEPDNLDLLYRTFHREYRVLRAEGGLTALEILASQSDVAVIISDQRMPQMSGTEFLSLTAVQYPDIIRIILTGYTDVEDLVEAINSGKVFKYVTKPWDADELKAIVKQALETHTVLKSRTEELRRALQQESLLYAVTNTIRSAPNYREMLQRIVETVGQMFEAQYCILRPFQDGQMVDEWFMYQSGRGDILETPDPQKPSTDLLRLLVWETTDVEVIQAVDTDERVISVLARQQAYTQTQIRSSLVVPLFYQLDLMAVLALHHCQESHIWLDHEVQLVITVSDQAALALSQARAYEQVRELAKREALVNTITSAIRSSLNPRTIFAAITQQLGEALQVDGCALSLWTKDDEYVQCVGLYDAARQASMVSDEWSLESPPTSVESVASVEPSLQLQQPQEMLPQSLVPIRGNPVLQQVLRTGKPVVIDDLDRQPESHIAEFPLRSASKALMVMPLLSDGQIIGSISLRQNTRIRKWQEAEINLVQVVAVQAALAVQQARLYQKTRQQAERLLEADRVKTEFFQNISHEFRTPLTLMIGPLESAINQQQDLPLEQSKIALRNSRRLLRLVNQLLDLQRFDAGRMQPSFRPCDLISFCHSTVESFQPYCHKKEIYLETDLKTCPLLYLDLERFDKVLYNLLSNAMKFTPTGGTITLRVEPLGDHCRLQVADTGIGIKPEQIPYLFERFRQAEGSANRSYEGSGLGLALVKELVELHKGQISVESIYGKGTTFTVWLQQGTAHLPGEQVLEIPAELNSSRASVEFSDVEVDITEDDSNNGGETAEENILLGENTSSTNLVLVVDDNPDLRRYVSKILRQSGYNVVVACNGAEGFEIAQRYQPEVIITDLMMPLVSGLDLIRLIRENPELKGTPMILLTAKADEETRLEGVERGADAYLSKPFNDRELLAEVKNLQSLKENERRISELNRYLTESVLKRFLPETMVKKAATGELALDLSPEPRLITILFSDIVGFTQMSNQLQSQGIAVVLNEYLAEMTRVIFANGGTVDKFVGDAVMALYGAPEELSAEKQVKQAVNSARQMLRSLDKLNQRWREQGIINHHGVEPVRFRCGIHIGTAVVGMFGSQERSDYTAIGPAVNMAARLQEVAHPNSILVSTEVANYLPATEILAEEFHKLKGIGDQVLTFMVNPEP
ncbi:Adenylate/Guanylate Cyclase [Planktothrix serta PCC 8927]|uniref:histidine kinase n=1 Tax=Planktothrix serta PCC 8927 TaxID=671068 RepID=A0A7Z9BVS6_9CYAN|nr:response regulator [Planktothrix serta]VXD23664.1 Adenylate/Guanylate Cyclase [Planktothrix serta PCC 8927]